jgi:hypothetical protein
MNVLNNSEFINYPDELWIINWTEQQSKKFTIHYRATLNKLGTY